MKTTFDKDGNFVVRMTAHELEHVAHIALATDTAPTAVIEACIIAGVRRMEEAVGGPVCTHDAKPVARA